MKVVRILLSIRRLLYRYASVQKSIRPGRQRFRYVLAHRHATSGTITSQIGSFNGSHSTIREYLFVVVQTLTGREICARILN